LAVLVPERPGHGATGGKYLEDQGGCDEADYSRSGYATADSIKAALSYLREQPFVRQDGTVIVGHSAGAWGALALAGENPKGVSAIIAFAPGRGGHANDLPNQVCAPHTLTAISHPICRGSWPMRSAPAAEEWTFACCRHPAARATGWRRPRPA
jgi:pimeloyl-ACP methyl ester carboxylesterase